MHEPLDWLDAPPPLSPGAVHLWRAHLDRLAPAPTDWLDDAERARLDRLQDPAPRRRFLAARGLLRRSLAAYLGSAPVALRFVIEPGGKPRLAHPEGALHFNLSHTGERVLLAVARCAVGVDIERERPVPNCVAIARRLWPAPLAEQLTGLAEPARSQRFVQLWTRFEAAQKAGGRGIFGKPGQRTISANIRGKPGQRTISANIRQNCSLTRIYRGEGTESILSFRVDPEHLGALAWDQPQPPRTLICIDGDAALRTAP